MLWNAKPLQHPHGYADNAPFPLVPFKGNGRDEVHM